MPRGEDRQELDFADTASATSARSTESPTDLEDSPTVKGTDDELSQTVRARVDTPNPVQGAEATMTERQPGLDPGAPTNPGMGEIVGDVAGSGRLQQSDIGAPPRGAQEAELADHGGTLAGASGRVAGLDETSGSDDPSAQAGSDNVQGRPRT